MNVACCFSVGETSFHKNKAEKVHRLKSLFCGFNLQAITHLQTFFTFSFLPKLSNKWKKSLGVSDNDNISLFVSFLYPCIENINFWRVSCWFILFIFSILFKTLLITFYHILLWDFLAQLSQANRKRIVICA